MGFGNLNGAGPDDPLDTETLARFRSLLREQSNEDLHAMISAAQFRLSELRSTLSAMKDERNRRGSTQIVGSNRFGA